VTLHGHVVLLLHSKLLGHHILVHHALKLLLHGIHIFILSSTLLHPVGFSFLMGHRISSKHVIYHLGERILIYAADGSICIACSTSHDFIKHSFYLYFGLI